MRPIGGGESHQTAWEEAKIVMGWAIKPTFLIDPEIEKYNESQLESQFSTLYEKWGPYVTINVGINEEYKKQAQKELGESIVYAIKTHEGEFVQKEAKPSILDKAKLAYEDLKAKINNLVTLGGKATQTVQKIIKEGLGQITSKIQELKKFGGARLTPPTEEKPIEKVGQGVGQAESKETENKIEKPNVEKAPKQVNRELTREEKLAEMQESLDDIVERIDVMSVEAAKLTGKEKVENEKKLEIEKPKEVEKEKEEKVKQEEVAKLCEKVTGVRPLQNKVIFNEVAWMGTDSGKRGSDEWIELKNISGSEINLNGWQLLDKDNQIKVIFPDKNYRGATPVISPSGFYLLERTGDDSALGVAADLIYTGGLSNTNEALYLFDENCQFEDEVLANPDWPAGNNSLKRTMERKSDFEWQTSANPGGTPKRGNSLGYVEHTGGITSPSIGPQISLSYSQQNPVNKEIEVTLSASNLKNATYDVKISIEDVTTTLSDIYNKAKKEWQSSYKYATSTFSGTSFSGNFKLKIKQEKNNFRGETDIFAKIRDSEKKTIQAETSGKINITEPEQATSTPPQEEEGETPTLEVVINEIQIDSIVGVGGTSDDWVELYNPTTQDISLAGLSIQKHSATSSCSIDVGFYKKKFPETAVISAQGFFLIIDAQANDNLKMIADMEIGWSLTEGNNIYLVGNEETIEGGNDVDIIDKVGFGENACFPEGDPAPNPPEGKSIQRKQLGLDSNDNSKDFVINENPNPTNSKGEAGPTIWTNYQISEDTTFTLQGSPYIIGDTLYVSEGNILTIEPGVTLKFYDNAGLNVNGTLRAIGQENKEIIFTSLSDSRRWRYINFSSSSLDSVLENCLIKNLSYGENQWAISIVSTSVIFENSNIEDTAANVIQLNNSSSSINNLTIKKNSTGAAMEILGGAPEIKNSKFIDTYAGMFIKEGSKAIIEGNYFEGIKYEQGAILVEDYSYPFLKDNNGTSTNTANGIFLSEIVNRDWQLEKNEGLPYYLNYLENMASTTLEIKPGVVIKFIQGGELKISGTLKAEGTEEEKILFTSLQGYSGEISFVSESASSSLKNVILEYGDSSGVVKVFNTNVDFKNTEFRYNNIALLLENSSSTVSNCVFSDNPAISVEINGGNPFIKDSNFSNGNVAIWIEGGEARIENNHFENFSYPTRTIFGRDTSSTFSGNSGNNNQSNKISLWDTFNNIWTYIDL